VYNQQVVLQIYDTIEEFNVDWKAECGQLNIARDKKKKKRESEIWNIEKKTKREAVTKVGRCAHKRPTKRLLSDDLCKAKVAQFYLNIHDT